MAALLVVCMCITYVQCLLRPEGHWIPWSRSYRWLELPHGIPTSVLYKRNIPMNLLGITEQQWGNRRKESFGMISYNYMSLIYHLMMFNFKTFENSRTKRLFFFNLNSCETPDLVHREAEKKHLKIFPIYSPIIAVSFYNSNYIYISVILLCMLCVCTCVCEHACVHVCI